MATLEDKILGEKLANYCSSSEDEEDDDESDLESKVPKTNSESSCLALPKPDKWEGTSTNTGPKGVLKDWQRFKQLENEKRTEDEQEKLQLMKKLTLTVRTTLEDDKAKEDEDLDELLRDDEFLVTYQKKRMEEMLKQTKHNFKFGGLVVFKDSQEFLDGIDKEHESVMIVVHISDESIEASRTMTNCLKILSRIYQQVKFCNLNSSEAGVSGNFKAGGVPALLIYKSGQLVGNFVRMSDELGSNFLPEDVQSFLVEHGMLEDKSCTPLFVRRRESEGSSDDDA